MKKIVLVSVALLAVLASAQTMLGDIFQLMRRDESAFPVATQRTGGLLYGTDAGRPYVSNGTTWVGVCTELTGCPSDGGGGGGGVTDLTGIAPIIVVSDGGNGYTISLGDTDAGIVGQVGAIYINDVISPGSTYGGQVVKRETTFNAMSFRVRTSGTGGTTNANILATSGLSSCDFSFPCNSAPGATAVAASGTCSFAPDDLITYVITSIGDCSVGPDIQGVVVVTGTTNNSFSGSGGNFVLKAGDTMTGQLAIQMPDSITPALTIANNVDLPVLFSQDTGGQLRVTQQSQVLFTSGVDTSGPLTAVNSPVTGGYLAAQPSFIITAGPGFNACPFVVPDGAIWHDNVYGFLRCEGPTLIRRLSPIAFDISGAFPQVDPTTLTFPVRIFTSSFQPQIAEGDYVIQCVIPGTGGTVGTEVELSTIPPVTSALLTVPCDCSPFIDSTTFPTPVDSQLVVNVISSDCTTTPFLNITYNGISY